MDDSEKRAHDLALLYCKHQLDSELKEEFPIEPDPDTFYETYKDYYDHFLVCLTVDI